MNDRLIKMRCKERRHEVMCWVGAGVAVAVKEEAERSKGVSVSCAVISVVLVA